MRRRLSRLAGWCLGLVFTFISSAAYAQRIVLVRPRSSDPTILSAFAHLQGELTAHDFEVIVVETSNAGAAPDELEQAAEQADAVAAVSLLRSKDVATADIWISDRVTGKTSRRTISTPERREGPNVLAVRAVDLLRASLREFGPTPKPPPDIVGAAPARAPEHVLDWAAAKPADASGFKLEAGMAAQLAASDFSPAFGPSVAVGYDPAQRLALRLIFQGPLWGARYDTEGAAATLREEQLMAELRFHLWTPDVVALTALAYAGVHHLSAQGEATAPYQAENDTAWTGLFGLGLGSEWWFARAAALTLRARALMLAPKPVVNVGADHVSFGQPLIQIAGGLDVSF